MRKGLGIIAVLGAVGAGAYWLITLHRHKFTRPFSAKRKAKDKGGKGGKFNYVVCLSCAKEFEYSMDTLEVGKQIDVRLEVQ